MRSRQVDLAAAAYKNHQVPAAPQQQFGYARYKLGYVSGKGEYANALNEFKKVIETAINSPTCEREPLAKAARRDMIPVYAVAARRHGVNFSSVSGDRAASRSNRRMLNDLGMAYLDPVTTRNDHLYRDL